LVEGRGKLASKPVNHVSRRLETSLMEPCLGFACTLLHISTFENSIELEAAVLVDWRKSVQVEMRVTESRGRRRGR
jgi:hypothetical protein